jgi:hypothetical protein
MEYPQCVVKAKLCEALTRLFEHDAYLLEHDAHELSISHRLGLWLQEVFPDWDVDCEYNLAGEETKRLSGFVVRADIVVHQRGKKRNLLVVEIKKASAPEEGDEGDRGKLCGFQIKYSYRHAVFMKLETGHCPVNIKRDVKMEWL